ncbi:MAG: acetyl-CoA C-acyltransferase [Rhodospirillales bacterium]|nr:acetyl-CoA C-acyltransferase [Rhodospirillales bacterium]MDE0379359.1 acetyl-CoA C-acyltransferase [Rhodospirillales bacterium]
MRRACIVDVVRTPFAKGREGGALSAVHPVDLLAHTLKGLVARTGIDPGAVDDVIAGCVIQVGEQAANIGRQAWLAAGFPEAVPAVTIDRKCGSAQQAMDFAAQGVMAGAYDLVIACGVEMMSRVPMGSNRRGKDHLGPMLRRRYAEGLVHQGISAELIAARWGLSRDALDAYALRSHQRAAAAEDRGVFARDILPVDGVATDEGIRRDTSAGKLAALEPAFVDAGTAERFPEIGWVVTAGNSSQVSDGASAMLIASEEMARRLQRAPRAAITHFAVSGDDPVLMLTGIIPATEKLLARSGRSLGEIDRFEVNEAFAPVVLAWAEALGADLDRVNVGGGAIAFGHPVGASGGRLTANLIGSLEESGGRLGLQTMCESGGMANATLIERLG